MKNSTTAFDKFLSLYKTKENLSKENRNTKTYELSFVTELCNTYSNDEDSVNGVYHTKPSSVRHCEASNKRQNIFCKASRSNLKNNKEINGLHQRIPQHFHRVQCFFTCTIFYLVTATGAGCCNNYFISLIANSGK